MSLIRIECAHDAQYESDRLDGAVRRFLRARGWKHTSEYYALWLFVREIDGVTLAVDQSMALWIEEHADDREPPAEPDGTCGGTKEVGAGHGYSRNYRRPCPGCPDCAPAGEGEEK